MSDLDSTLLTKYRPQEFTEIYGHAAELKALAHRLAQPSPPHFYIFKGPAGTGKTTMARLIARHFDCEINEIDAASHSGVDDTRALVEVGEHMSLSGTGNRMFIIDEAHNLSAKGWEPLLKLTEEPPAHLFIAVCTTRPDKIPPTIASRGYPIGLKEVPSKDMDEFLDDICKWEGIKVPDDVLNAIRNGANGSPRWALNALDKVRGCKTAEEAHKLMSRVAGDNEPVQVLCGMMLTGQGFTLTNSQNQIEQVPDEAFDDAISHVCRYMTRVMVNTKSDKTARRAWKILEAFNMPTFSFDPKVNFLAAFGRVLWEMVESNDVPRERVRETTREAEDRPRRN